MGDFKMKNISRRTHPYFIIVFLCLFISCNITEWNRFDIYGFWRIYNLKHSPYLKEAGMYFHQDSFCYPFVVDQDDELISNNYESFDDPCDSLYCNKMSYRINKDTIFLDGVFVYHFRYSNKDTMILDQIEENKVFRSDTLIRDKVLRKRILEKFPELSK
jgi:hypothetical protein